MGVSYRFGLFVMLQLAAATYLGCGSDSKDDADDDSQETPNNNDAENDTLRVVFTPMFSAYIPGHDSKLPVIVDGKTGADVTFTVADTSIADVEKTADGAMLLIRKAGTTTVVAKAGNETGRAKLTVTAFTAEEWEAGNTRYNNGTGLGLAEAGVPSAPPTSISLNPNTACASCHGEASEIGDIFGADVEHTPAQTGGYSDQELINIITNAQKPANVGMHTMIPASIWKMFHKWAADDTQKRGLIAYLRSLTPKAQQMMTFPTFPRDGGIPRVDAGAAVP